MKTENNQICQESHCLRPDFQVSQISNESSGAEIITEERRYVDLLIKIVNKFNHDYFQSFKCRLEIEDSLAEDDIFNQKDIKFKVSPDKEIFKVLENYFVSDQSNIESSVSDNHVKGANVKTDHLSHERVST